MRRLAIHGYREATDALARRLDIATLSERRFEYEGARGISRQQPDVARRRMAADFLVRIDENNRHDRRLEAEVPDGLQCHDQLCQAAFHVERPGPVNHVAVDAKRPLFDGTDRPDRVEVANNEL